MEDPVCLAVVRRLKRRRTGPPELFAYRADGDWRPIRSDDINEFIKAQLGEGYSAKDFRTWNATVLAAVALAVSWQAASVTARKRAVTRAMAEVAQYLGNTPTVCRSSYVDPRVIDRYREGRTIRSALDQLGEGTVAGQLSIQGPIEAAVLDLLDDEGRARRAA